MEATALTKFTLDPNLSTHQLHQPRRDGQPQPCTSIRACRRSVSLCERIEDRNLLLGRNADARICDRKMEFHVVRSPRSCFDIENHLALPSELDGIADQIDDELSQPSGVSYKCSRDIGTNFVGEFQAFLVCPETECLHRVAKGVSQIELSRVDLELSGFDFRIIQDVIDQGKQRIS